MVTMTATQDGVEVANETVNPSELKTWPVFFSGEGYADVKIYFDGELIRKDGRFVPPELAGLNPENLV